MIGNGKKKTKKKILLCICDTLIENLVTSLFYRLLGGELNLIIALKRLISMPVFLDASHFKRYTIIIYQGTL